MGRGLSTLQRDLLTLAARNRVAEYASNRRLEAYACGNRRPVIHDLHPIEAMSLPRYGLTDSDRRKWESRWANFQGVALVTWDRGQDHGSEYRILMGRPMVRWDRRRVGTKRYSAIQVATIKACNRLTARGLMFYDYGHPDGWQLRETPCASDRDVPPDRAEFYKSKRTYRGLWLCSSGYLLTDAGLDAAMPIIDHEPRQFQLSQVAHLERHAAMICRHYKRPADWRGADAEE